MELLCSMHGLDFKEELLQINAEEVAKQVSLDTIINSQYKKKPKTRARHCIAAVEGQTDKTSKWKSNLLLLPPLNSTINNMSSDYHSRIQNFAAAAGEDNQDSLQRVMHLNCWAHQS
ncbi:hypothetical protein Dsin_027691 [Dipteronia sinensis]|uniref:Uncharacterized protein n=1 Tax=Dipteronia sinensis TaxID=43782 RepID=A0AAD9ZP63_9ROSI|nr:hypothetical protein Dsin_027691 [Dipteronia sinensis]